ncbi:MAG: exodeoxyribonuclease VII large subunit, partial [Clostridia bacterium]
MLITVTQLNNFLKGMIDCESMLSSLSVQGEVCNYRLSYDSVYFSLKDGTSQIDCFSFLSEKNTFAQVNLDGMQIIARGRINFLQKTGKLSFFINQIESTDKLGESYLRLLALKKKLEKEGCFARELKKTINKAQTIGVVSSAKGAVIADIFQVATRRNPSANIILYPVKVQGLGADTEICEGIDYFSNSSDVDVVIVARGGGSAEDLSVFNAESIVRALNRCCKPTVSAVGHEVDFTLCDLAADARGATPSEAAELVTNDI